MKANDVKTTTTELTDLEQRLDKLALAVLDGKPGAREEYELTKAEIARLRGEDELQARAGKQAAIREESERKTQAEAHQQELERRFAELGTRLKELAPRLDEAADALVRGAQEFLKVADEQYHVALELGLNRPRLRRGDMVANAVLWRLSALGIVARPNQYWRRPLAEILGLGEVGAGRQDD